MTLRYNLVNDFLRLIRHNSQMNSEERDVFEDCVKKRQSFLTKVFSNCERELMTIQKVLTWKLPHLTLLSVFIANILIWLLSFLSPISLLSTFLAISFGICSISFSSHLAEWRSSQIEANSFTAVEGDLLQISELASHAARYSLQIEVSISCLWELRNNNHKKFLYLTIVNFTLLAIIGSCIPGIVICYLLVMCPLILPGIIYHQLPSKLRSFIQPLLISVERKLRIRRRRTKTKDKKRNPRRCGKTIDLPEHVPGVNSDSDSDYIDFAPADLETTANALADAIKEFNNEARAAEAEEADLIPSANVPVTSDIDPPTPRDPDLDILDFTSGLDAMPKVEIEDHDSDPTNAEFSELNSVSSSADYLPRSLISINDSESMLSDSMHQFMLDPRELEMADKDSDVDISLAHGLSFPDINSPDYTASKSTLSVRNPHKLQASSVPSSGRTSPQRSRRELDVNVVSTKEPLDNPADLTKEESQGGNQVSSGLLDYTASTAVSMISKLTENITALAANAQEASKGGDDALEDYEVLDVSDFPSHLEDEGK